MRAAQVLNGLEFFWEPINALCRMLTARLEWGVTVNAYITPAAARGFTPHSDHQDVMILQLDGAKHWTVYHRPILNPTAKHKVGRTVRRAIIAGGLGYILPRVPAIIVRTGIGPEFMGRNNCTNNEVNRCHLYEGCPEGTSTPDTGSQKLFALGASLTWFFLVKCCR